MSEKIVLIDGHSILNRAFYGLPDLTNAEGVHTNAMYGFLNILFKILEEEKPEYLAVAFDLSKPTFRHKMYDAYKGTRKPAPEEFRQQVPLMKEVLRAMDITTMELEGYEADDLLGTIAKLSEAKGLMVSVVSGDRDLLQLASDNIRIRIPKTKKGGTEIEDYNTAEVVEAYGVTPLEFIDMKALMGDTSDNIPGAPGIGPKTAGALIGKYHTIDKLYECIDEVTAAKTKQSLVDNEEQVRLSKVLATINVSVPYEFDYDKARIGNFFTPQAYELFKKYNFKTHLKHFDLTGVTSAVMEVEYQLVEDLSQAEEVFALLAGSENAGVSIIDDGDNVYAVGIYLEDKVYVIPTAGFVTGQYLLDKLYSATSCHSDNATGIRSTRQIAIVNLKDKLGLWSRFDSSDFVDVSLAAYVINPLQDNYKYDGLASMCHLGTIKSYDEIAGKSSLAQLNMLEPEKIYMLAANECYVALLAFEQLKKELIETQQWKLYCEMEMPLMYILHDMEMEGVLVDGGELHKLGEEFKRQTEVLEQEIYEACGHEFNINSPKQLGVVLFEEMQLPGAKKTKSGYSTAADVLDKLAVDYPVVKKILDYRQVAKLKSTYADGLGVYIQKDGRIHGKFNQTVTATGRLSSTEPNLQNIPIRVKQGAMIRKVFIPKAGCVFVDADYSQIELRILSSMSGDEKLCEAYRQAEDIHRITASQVFKVPLEEVTKEMRSNAKAVNFGIIYGISSFGLSQDLSISKKEAAGYIKKYFETYPTIESYINGMVESAKKNGYAITMDGRRRPVPELASSNFMTRSFGERIAMNSPIQGTAADIMKRAMILVYNELKRQSLKSKMIIQVHDEILIEALESECAQVQELVVSCMEQAASLKVPLEVDCKIGKDWLEAH